MKPTGAASVMADRARGEVAADDALTALYRRLEFFPTPPWAARAGGELIAALDPGLWCAWDPACGEGHLAHGLSAAFYDVRGSDIHDYDRGRGSCARAGQLQHHVMDFLSREPEALPPVDWIVMNHPFQMGVEFVETGLRRARRGVAAFCRSGWLDTHGRWPFFFSGPRPCDLEAAFFDRVNLTLGGWQPKSTEKGGSTSTAYSWFVWFQDRARPSWLDDVQAIARAATGEHHIVTRAIPPGTKARLTHPNDARDWGVRAPCGGLFDPRPAEMAAAAATIDPHNASRGGDHG
jgi:hypothetical protein